MRPIVRFGSRAVAAILGTALVIAACGEPAGEPTGTTAASPSTTLATTTTTTSTTSTTIPPPATGTTVVSGEGLVGVPGAGGDLPPDLEVGCRGGGIFPLSALDTTVAVEERPEFEAAIAPFLESGEGEIWPQTGWRVLHETADEATLVWVGRTAPRVGFMWVSLEDGAWAWSGSSLKESCPLEARIPEGLNSVDWRLDPEADALTPESTTIHLLATERECVSGQPMGDRLREPHVVLTTTQVRIAMAAEPPPGEFQNCPGNPEQEVVIELAIPLGDRDVVDGRAVLGNLEDLLG